MILMSFGRSVLKRSLMSLFDMPARFFVRWVLSADALSLLKLTTAYYYVPNAVADQVIIFTVPAGQCWQVMHINVDGAGVQTYDMLGLRPLGGAYGALKVQVAAGAIDYECASTGMLAYEGDAIVVDVVASTNVGYATFLYKRVF